MKSLRVRPPAACDIAGKLAAQHHPNLILLDSDQPHVTAEAMLRQLKADQRTRHIPVIALSADPVAARDPVDA